MPSPDTLDNTLDALEPSLADALGPEHAPFVSTASNFDKLRETDPEVYAATVKETHRQADYIRLIPSENYTSAAVLQAMATVFANKYSEGYPGKRYYEGNEYVDQVEELARNRAKKLFGADSTLR